MYMGVVERSIGYLANGHSVLTQKVTPEQAEKIAKESPSVWDKIVANLPTVVAKGYETYLKLRGEGKPAKIPPPVSVPVSAFAPTPTPATPGWVLPVTLGVLGLGALGTVVYLATRKGNNKKK